MKLSRSHQVAVPVAVLAMLGLLQLRQPVSAEWGNVGGYAPTQLPPLVPSSSDTDGDGIPNAWEDANLLDKTNPADALSDFDMDGLTALQDYQLSLATGGQYGNPLGKWTVETVPRPPGFIAPLPSTSLIECASNGIILVRAEGVLTGTTTVTSYPYTWSPATGTWTRIAAPDGFPSVTSLTPLDVNSSGQVVGYFNSGGTKGFIWTPDENGGHTSVYHLNSGGTQTNAIPTRISDSGYVVGYEGSLGGRSIAATASGTEITFPDMEIDPVYRDVNDYGEFIGTAYNPYTWKSEIFLAAPGYPIFLTGIEQDAFDGGPEVWGLIPDIDPSAITWLADAPMDGWFRGGIALDRTTGLNVDVREGHGAEFYWHSDLTEYSGNYWYSYPGFSQLPGTINDWGEFAGTYSGYLARTSFTFSSYYEEHEDITYYYASQDGYDSLTDDGLFFYDGRHHVSKSLPSVYGISNDPKVLTGTPFSLWSGSLTVPISGLMPVGFPTTFESARLADNGNVILQQSFNTPTRILKPAQDSDGDGMPDDWEVYYGFNPADPSDAGEDANQNGFSNLAEFRMRTDPRQILGITAPSVDLRPGIDTDGDGIPNVWEWSHGLNYIDASDASADPDGDGLTNLQEFRLGTDPHNPDTDGDGLSDGWEVANGLDPNDNGSRDPNNGANGDPDGDGFNNFAEQNSRTDPKSSTSFPIQVIQITKGTSGQSQKLTDQTYPYSGFCNWGAWWVSGDWHQETIKYQAVTPIYQFLKIEGIDFPEMPPATAYQRKFEDATIFNSSSINTDTTGNEIEGGVTMTRVWIKAPPKTYDQKFFFLKVRETSTHNHLANTNTRVFVDSETIEVLIPSGQNLSAPIDIKFLPTIANGCDVNAIISLFPIEVVDCNKNKTSDLKVGKMSEPFVLTGVGNSAVLNIDQDPDRFFLRIRGGAGLAGVSMKVSTDGNPDISYNDGASQINLVSAGSDVISKSLLLVSDDIDDAHPVDSIADNSTGDRTFKIQLGGHFDIDEIKIGNGGWQVVGAEYPARKNKKVIVKLVNCLHGFPYLKSRCWSAGDISVAEKNTKERFAQAGVDLEFSEIEGPNIGVTGWLSKDEFPVEVTSGALNVPQKIISIIDGVPGNDLSVIMIYLVKRLDGDDGDLAYGISLPPKYLASGNERFGNKIFIGNKSSGYSGDYTPAHEILHILMDAVHGDFQNEFTNSNMVWHTPGTSNVSIDSAKRISQRQNEKILLNPLAK